MMSSAHNIFRDKLLRHPDSYAARTLRRDLGLGPGEAVSWLQVKYYLPVR